MEATVRLVRQLGGVVAGLGFAVELDFLKGREKFSEYDVMSLLRGFSAAPISVRGFTSNVPIR